MSVLRRPTAAESSAYFRLYIDQVTSDDFLQTLKDAKNSTTQFLSELTEEQWNHRYAEGKWSLKEAFIHLIDTERIFAYRALRIARNDKAALLGYEQDDYIPFCNAENRSSESIIEEYKAVRESTTQLFKNLRAEDLNRVGTASGNSISVLAIGFIIAGHEVHHIRLAKERYLN